MTKRCCARATRCVVCPRPQPQEVAEDLVPKILSTTGNGQKVEFLTTDRVLKAFFRKFALGEKSQYIDDDGNVIKRPGSQYQDNGVAKQY